MTYALMVFILAGASLRPMAFAVDGFASLAACERAGVAYMKQVGDDWIKRASFVCVPKS